MGRLILLLSLIGAPALAETLMTGADFDAYTSGKTLTYGLTTSETHGVEQYLPDRRVIWSPAPGSCVEGIWYEQDTNICFLYENDPEPKCWEVFRTPNGIRAVFTTRPDTTVLFEALENPAPLVCPGPDMLS